MKSQLKTIKVSEKGQITIPTEIQKETGIKKGDNLFIFIKNNNIMLKRIDETLSKMNDDFKDMEHYTEESLKEVWQNEPEVWEQYLKPKQKRK
jgi:AbrB family looped-hinge helix DNA binding protein